MEPPTEDTTSNTAPQPNDGETAGAVEEEQAQPEPPIPVQTVQPPVPASRRSRLPWPHGSGLPDKKWYNSDNEEQDEHDDPPLQATTSNVPVPIARTSKRPREAEPRSDSKLIIAG
jgi:hypothetical protein